MNRIDNKTPLVGVSIGNEAFKWLPSEVIDLGALVTEDLPQRSWGKAMLKRLGFSKQNAFEVIHWTFPSPEGIFQDRMHTTPCSIMGGRM